MDATRADGTLVMLKAVQCKNSPDEIPVGTLLSSKRLASPRNHCIPYLEVIDPPEGSDDAFIVLPLLVNRTRLPLETIGEAVEFFRQLFEVGVVLKVSRIRSVMPFLRVWSSCTNTILLMSQNSKNMHKYKLTYIFRDCKFNNIMVDAHHLYNAPPHPFARHMRRDFTGEASLVASPTTKPVMYYLIDFDLSKEYPPGATRLENPPWGGDHTVPEHLLPDAQPCDPFPVDVYCLGNCIKQEYIDVRLLYVHYSYAESCYRGGNSPKPRKALVSCVN